MNGENYIMIKIFQLIRSIHLGGAEIVAFNLSEYCKTIEDDFEFLIIELHRSDDEYSTNKKNELKSKDISFVSLGTKSKTISLLIGHFTLAYQILRRKPDIIHSHTDLPDLVLSNTKRLFSFFHIKFPVVVRTIHNTVLWPTHRRLGKFTEAAFVDDWVVGVSVGALESYKILRHGNNLSISPHLQIIYNGCNFPQKKEHPFNIISEKINVAFCGRFEEQKGIDILIERIKAINHRFKEDFVFHIIGDGTYQNKVRHLSERNSNVLVYNSVPNIADKLYAFDFIIMPSRFEGLALVSIEASFSKVPVIVAFAKGLSETLPPDWSLQFQLENEQELMSVFDNIKNNKYDLIQLKNQAYAFATEKFSLSVMIESYSKLYMSLNN